MIPFIIVCENCIQDCSLEAIIFKKHTVSTLYTCLVIWKVSYFSDRTMVKSSTRTLFKVVVSTCFKLWSESHGQNLEHYFLCVVIKICVAYW